MRHGYSQANKQDLIVSDPTIGCAHYGLTDRGRDQVRDSVGKSGLGSSTLIISSDFKRTRETAQICQSELGCGQPLLETALRERFFGKLEGTSGGRYLEVWEADSQDDVHTPFGAESPRHLGHRLRSMLNRLDESYQNETILLVSHGDTLRFLQLVAAKRELTEHMKIGHFQPAEIRPLETLIAAEES